MTSDRIMKLPKWARDIIARNNSEILSLRQKLAELQNTEPTKIVVDRDHMGDGALFFAPDRARVEFHLDTGTIEVKITEGRLHVMGSDSLVMLPRASNVVDLEVR